MRSLAASKGMQRDHVKPGLRPAQRLDQCGDRVDAVAVHAAYDDVRDLVVSEIVAVGQDGRDHEDAPAVVRLPVCVELVGDREVERGVLLPLRTPGAQEGAVELAKHQTSRHEVGRRPLVAAPRHQPHVRRVGTQWDGQLARRAVAPDARRHLLSGLAQGRELREAQASVARMGVVPDRIDRVPVELEEHVPRPEHAAGGCSPTHRPDQHPARLARQPEVGGEGVVPVLLPLHAEPREARIAPGPAGARQVAAHDLGGQHPRALPLLGRGDPHEPPAVEDRLRPAAALHVGAHDEEGVVDVAVAIREHLDPLDAARRHLELPVAPANRGDGALRRHLPGQARRCQALEEGRIVHGQESQVDLGVDVLDARRPQVRTATALDLDQRGVRDDLGPRQKPRSLHHDRRGGARAGVLLGPRPVLVPFLVGHLEGDDALPVARPGAGGSGGERDQQRDERAPGASHSRRSAGTP
jgi:hypothetical protein